MNWRWKAYFEKQPWSLTESLHIVRETPDGRLEVLRSPEVQSYDPGSFVPQDKPFLKSDYGSRADVRGFMQAVMDAAWEEGMRPTGFADVKNEIAAVRYHLEDMRKLALPKE